MNVMSSIHSEGSFRNFLLPCLCFQMCIFIIRIILNVVFHIRWNDNWLDSTDDTVPDKRKQPHQDNVTRSGMVRDSVAGRRALWPAHDYILYAKNRKEEVLAARIYCSNYSLDNDSFGRQADLYARRPFFSGMAGNMAFVSAPMYISEIADHKIRGFLSSTIFTMFLLGVFIMYCVGPYLPYYGAPLIGGGFAFIELVTFSFMPESPYYLYSKNKIEEAEKSLRYFKRYANVEQEMKNIAESLEKEKTEKGNFKSLFIAKNNRKAVLIMTVLNAGQNFSGIMVIFMNLHLILNQAGSIYITDSLAGILFATTTLVAVCVASLLIDRCGRKALLITSSILTGACLLTIAIYFHLKFSGYDVLTVSWIPIVFVMIYAASFKLGMGLVPIVITAEIFSPKVKAIGMTLADASYVLWGIVSLQVYQWVTHLSGLHASFYVFSLSSFLLGVFTLLYIPETKGKTLEEIQTVLKGEELTTNEPREGQVDIPLMKLED
ncbi:hypothetical protein NQ318_011357 [Aromia moschata]|uniref:Facilitated trehalose transporter Tret1-like n=1 Tax=Aromia moschata TaxID=1265417 RepID=A0AAV8YUR3_9CUCU|nr:hypothetical protein NQ318_011357 [Aromia moschata]